jgi:ribonuclease HI
VITVSTDGSCLRNPGGAIGWAWANHDGTHGSGAVASGTNQIAELMAVLEAITSHPGDEPLCIEADSQYAIKCASEWVHGWRRKGWRTASGSPVQNLALVQAIERAIADRPGPVTFVWVRGHQGDQFNERADELAGIAAREMRDGTYAGPVTVAIPVPVAVPLIPVPVIVPVPDIVPVTVSAPSEPAVDTLF